MEDVLIIPEHSISQQVSTRFLPFLVEYEPGQTPEDTEHEIALRNKFYNADGLGVAWYVFARTR